MDVEQRTVNMLVFGFVGAILGILVAALTDQWSIQAVALAIAAGTIFGVVVGRGWSTEPKKRP